MVPETSSGPRCCGCAQLAGSQAVDKLTGFHDRWGWDAAASEILQHSQLLGEDLALLLVDLDSFKRINDDFGHMAGDAALKAVSDSLRATTRKVDLLGRYGGHGGDEFLVLLPQTNAAEAEHVAERIRAGIRGISLITTAITGAAVTLTGITASVGISMSTPAEETTLDDLIRQADNSLRFAKEKHHRGRRARSEPIATINDDVFAGHLLELRHLMADDWIPGIMLALSTGPRRCPELLNSIRSSAAIDEQTSRNRQLQPRIILETLWRMEDHGLVSRDDDSEGWPWSVRYELTPAAHDLLGALTPAILWCSQHADLAAGLRKVSRAVPDQHEPTGDLANQFARTAE